MIKHVMSAKDISLCIMAKDTECTYVMPHGVVVNIVSYANKDKHSVIVSNAFSANSDIFYGKSYGSNYADSRWLNSITTIDGKTILENWIELSKTK